MRNRWTRAHARSVVLALVSVSLIAFGTVGALPSYDMDVEVDWASGSYWGTVTATFGNTASEPLDTLVFRLFPNDETIYAGASIRVLEATQDGATLDVEPGLDPTFLTVALPSLLLPSQTISVSLRFEGSAGPSPAIAPAGSAGYGILSKNEQSLVLTAFYPVLAVYGENGPILSPTCPYGDALWSQAADYSVRLTAASELAVASTGRLNSSALSGDSLLHVIDAKGARDFALVLMSQVAEVELQTGSQTLRAWFDSSNVEAAAQTLALAASAHDLYTGLVGPLPYDEIDFVEVPLYRAAGVEFTGLILVSTTYTDRPHDPFYDIIVSHEMAHQWFYAAVGNDPITEAWLDEGPATFLSNAFLRNAGRAVLADAEAQRWDLAYRSAHAEDPESVVATSSCMFSTSSSYSAHVYSGGAQVLRAIEDSIGTSAFFAGLSKYYSDHVSGIGTARALFDAFEQTCACDLSDVYRMFGFPSD